MELLDMPGAKPVELPITPEDIEQVREAAEGRQDYAQRMGLVTPGVERPPERRLRDDYLGCVGELKVVQHFDLDFDPAIGVLDRVDCKILEVRSRRVETGRDLAIRPLEKWRLPHVLVWIDRERMTATLVGWLCAWEGRERATPTMWQPKKEVWFIPPPYHTIKSLEEWIESGHPLHWCPEKYR